MEPELPSGPDSYAAAVRLTLERTQPWVRFLAVLGFIYIGLMIVGGLIGGAAMLVAGEAQAIAFLFVYPLLGVLYLYPALCLLRYANGIRSFTRTNHPEDLAAALDAQRAFFKFVGVLVVIGLIFGLLAGIAAVTIGVMGVAGLHSIGQ